VAERLVPHLFTKYSVGTTSSAPVGRLMSSSPSAS
jgi:hypothetical protein